MVNKTVNPGSPQGLNPAVISRLSGEPILYSPNGFIGAARQALTKLGSQSTPFIGYSPGDCDGYLSQADHLAVWEVGSGMDKPSQASLRRAVSTAYYALFHLLIEDAASRWDGSGEARSGLERAFTHVSMKQASLQFRQPVWQNWYGRQQSLPLAVQHVASAFVDLQEERHTADYDNHERWSVTEVQTT